ncbi:MAG: hypothetical protein HFI58_03635 [Lachnospiraceae bacterium]|jgi:hypothetical protein|nr:hypothetical protein [Lachnospiraceae bacterium]MCI8984895.1 hypothetical protein [Lachnospiraceae bacterium]MCI9253921.1 hypothetical protein [Lachnospiraceae bacterium]MDE6995054.1 hypothetical protein [Lachnospiraceae bacterium]
MTLLQEAYTLMQRQPEKNIRLIVDLLRTMSVRENAQTQVFRRTGLAKEAVNLPGDFDETFDALDHDIEEMFYGDSL